MKHIVFRAAGSRSVGSGHLMRCIALAEAYRGRGGKPHFVLDSDAGGLTQALAQRGFSWDTVESPVGSSDDFQATTHVAKTVGADALVIDGYGFPDEYYVDAGSIGPAVVAIHDWRTDICADIVVNQNVGAERFLHSDTLDGTQYLFGHNYVMLRSEFLAHPSRTPRVYEPSDPLRVLITVGGSDPCNATAQILAALPTSPALVARVVVGPNNPYRAEIEAAAREALYRGHIVELEYAVSDMSWPMACADVAITAAGTTMWELAYMGIPTAVLALVDNQVPTAEALAERGWAFSLGDAEVLGTPTLTHKLEQFLSDSSLQLHLLTASNAAIDGLGNDRILDAIES